MTFAINIKIMASNDYKRLEDRPPVTTNQLTTIEDLINFRNDLLREIRSIIGNTATQPVKRWLKSFEVKELLHISTGTLHNLRTNGVIPFSKIGGVVFYDIIAVETLLEKNSTFQKLKKR
jgi:hypothetical protein